MFLIEFGIEQLPYAYILVAIVSALVAWTYSRLTRIFAINRLIIISQLFFIVSLFIFWILFQHSNQHNYRAAWFIYTLYVWVAIFGVLSATQFWLLANYVFNVREAKRVFGFLGGGAISGGIVGGYLTKYLTPVIGTENLLLLCVVFLIACLIILRFVWTRSAKRNYLSNLQRSSKLHSTSNSLNPLKLIMKSRHLLYIAAIIGVGALVANMVDYQFNALASDRIQDEVKLTAFFGFWYSNVSLIALVVQLFLTGNLLRHLGVGTALYVLPFGVVLGAVAVLIVPSLVTATIIMLSEGSLKKSVNKAGMELVSLPIPAITKNRTKTFIDIFVDTTFNGLSGIILLIMVTTLGVKVQYISVMIIVLIVIWFFFIRNVNHEYLNAFRLAIKRRHIDIFDPSLNLNDPAVFSTIKQVLDGNNEQQIIYVLRLLRDSSTALSPSILIRLLSNPSISVIIKALQVALKVADEELIRVIEGLVNHENERVRIVAIRYVCRHSYDKHAKLTRYLNDSDIHIQTSAMMCVAGEYKEDTAFRSMIDIAEHYHKLFDSSENNNSTDLQFLKISSAQVIGEASSDKLNPELYNLLHDSDPQVLLAAVESAGKICDIQFSSRLIELLESRSVRRMARQSLSRYGDDILPDLKEKLTTQNTPHRIKIEIIKILPQIGSHKAMLVLVDNLSQDDLELHHEMIKALSKLRANCSELRFPRKTIQNSIIREVENHHKLLTLYLHHHSATSSLSDKAQKQSRSIQFMSKVIQERLDGSLERMFRLLGLIYPPDDIYNAYRGIINQESQLHINSVEFLDNLLDPLLRRYIIPIMESQSIDERFRNLSDLFESKIPHGVDYRNWILDSFDDWLTVSALYVIAHSNNGQWIDTINRYSSSSVTIINETAKYAERQLRKVG